MSALNKPTILNKEYTLFAQATDATNISMRGFADLRSLFESIQLLAVSNPKEAESLAHIGIGLADNCFNVVDGIDSELKRKEV